MTISFHALDPAPPLQGAQGVKGDPGSTTKDSIELAVGGPVLRASDAGTWLNVRRYGAVGDYVTDDSNAFETAIAAAALIGAGVFIPPGNFNITRTIDFGRVPFRGEAGSLIYTTSVTGTLFRITANASLESNYYGDLAFLNNLPTPSDYTNTAAIEITGDNTGYFQHNTFQRMIFYGFYQGLKITKGTNVTGFGNESTYAWNSHTGLTFRSSTHAGKYGVRFTAGSGTGNSFMDMQSTHGAGDSNSALLRYEGACVVGDIILASSHLGACSIAIDIASTAVYLSNISLPGCQFDDQCFQPLRVGSTTLPVKSLHLVSSNLGGGVATSSGFSGFVTQSVIHDLQAGEWLAGNEKLAGAGTSTIPLFSIDLTTYSGTAVTVTVQGLVGGLGGCLTTQDFLVQRDTGAPNAAAATAVYINNGGSTSGGAKFALSTTASGSTLTFSVTVTNGAGGGTLESQIRAVAGSIRVTRL